MQLLYATTNPGKFQEVASQLAPYKIHLYSPADFHLNIKVDEIGKSLEENALLKLNAYLSRVPDDVVVMSDDTGVEIDALAGEPGIYVRRWRGYPMDDEEIIQYCLQRMQDIPDNQRWAQFRTVIALGYQNNIHTFNGVLRGKIVKQPIKLRIAGFPFESLFYIPKYQLMLGELHQLSQQEKLKKGFFSHREKAIRHALPTLLQLLS